MGVDLEEMVEEMRRRMQVADARGSEHARVAAQAMILTDLGKRFEAGNPTFAWLAYDLCARANISIPTWVSDYLAQVAAEMLKLLRQPPCRDVGVALASALGMKTGRGATGAFTAAKHAYEASELLRVYQMLRFAGAEHSAALRELAKTSRASPGMVLEERTIRRRLEKHYPGWRELDCEPQSLGPEL